MARYVAKLGRSDGSVRDVHSRSQFGGMRVPVFTADPKGDEIEGHIRVPNEWTHTKPFTNERHQFKQYIAENIKRWVEWREHKGWRLNSKPLVRGPFEAPTPNAAAEKPDWSIYTVTAYFQPTEVMTLGLEDAYELRIRAQRYGIDIDKPKPVSTPVETGKDVIVEHGPFDDPMVIAEARRQQYGLKREDLLLGPLEEPL
jgi:hypothetical protein